MDSAAILAEIRDLAKSHDTTARDLTQIIAQMQKGSASTNEKLKYAVPPQFTGQQKDVDHFVQACELYLQIGRAHV